MSHETFESSCQSAIRTASIQLFTPRPLVPFLQPHPPLDPKPRGDLHIQNVTISLKSLEWALLVPSETF